MNSSFNYEHIIRDDGELYCGDKLALGVAKKRRTNEWWPETPTCEACILMHFSFPELVRLIGP